MTVLQLNSVTCSYGKQEIIKKIDFSIEEGELLALVGESGSGKTTLLRAIQGLLDLSGGEVLHRGDRILGPSEVLVAGHDGIKTVFQDFQLQEGLTAENNIKHELIVYPLEKQKEVLSKLIEQCEMQAFQDRFPRELSGGMRQKVALAKALVDQPDVILMDEPFSNLDSLSKDSFKRVIKNFKQQGVAFMYVTHDINDALSFADRIVYLREGRLELNLPTEQLFDHISSYQFARFLGLENVMDREKAASIAGIETNATHVWIPPKGIKVRASIHGSYKVSQAQDLGNYSRYLLNNGLVYCTSADFKKDSGVDVAIDISSIRELN